MISSALEDTPAHVDGAEQSSINLTRCLISVPSGSSDVSDLKDLLGELCCDPFLIRISTALSPSADECRQISLDLAQFSRFPTPRRGHVQFKDTPTTARNTRQAV